MKSSKMAQRRSSRIKRRQKVKGLLLCVTSTLIALMLLTGKLLAESSTKAAGNSPVGPYTEIQLPLEDLPSLNESLVYNPVLDQPYTEVIEVSEYSEENDYYIGWRETEYFERGATLQILYVLDDPRPVPEARFAYYSSLSGGVIPPNNYNPKTVNVYVRVQAPEDSPVHDPIFAGYYEDLPLGSTPALYVSAGVPSDYPDRGFPDLVSCAVPEYASGTEPYSLPSEIEGGLAVGKDGLYDPTAYAPPQPWYFGVNQLLEPGEIREGWISCMAPDVPLEDIIIYSGYWYTPEPEIQFVGPGFSWILAEQAFRLDPDFSSLEMLGLKASDLPKTIEECATFDHCLTLESRTAEIGSEILGECTERAKEAGLEQGLCSYLDDPGWPTETLNTVVFYTETFEEASRDSPLAWSYTLVNSLPGAGIRLEDIPLTFINEKGEEKNTRGSVVFNSPKVVRVDTVNKAIEFLFVSKVVVEPVGLSDKELQGFDLSRIDANVEVFNQADAPHEVLYIKGIRNDVTSVSEKYMRVNYWYPVWEGIPNISEGKRPFVDLFLHEPASPLEGFVFTVLDTASPEPLDFMSFPEQDLPLPSTVWVTIEPSEQANQTTALSRALFPAKGVKITNSLESRTDMCDIVDCLEVQDPDDKNNETRTVPLLCPGEWANNFVIDGLNIEDVDYIGEPVGMGLRPNSIRAYLQSREVPPKTWIYKGKILGGLSSWWSTKNYHNSARTIDLLTGNYLDSDPRIIPYYFKDADVYYLPTEDSSQVGGWIMGKASDKLLIFDVIQKADSVKANNALLFLEEGPAWISSCSRSLLPSLTSSEVYAPPLTGSSFEIYSYHHTMVELMPGMKYPVSEPRITGVVLRIGETGPTINDQVLMPIDIKIVPGRSSKPIIYVPSEDSFYPAVERETTNNSVFFGRVEAELIPPDSSLVMVKLKKISPEGRLDCRTSPENIQLSYPGYYPITTSPDKLLEFNMGLLLWICSDDDFTEKWVVFKFPSLDIDSSELLLSIKGEDNWVFWNLAEK